MVIIGEGRENDGFWQDGMETGEYRDDRWSCAEAIIKTTTGEAGHQTVLGEGGAGPISIC